VQLKSSRDGFGASAHAEFAIDAANLSLDSIGGDDQFLGYFGVSPPGDEQPQYPPLLPAQWLDEPSLDGVLWGMCQSLYWRQMITSILPEICCVARKSDWKPITSRFSLHFAGQFPRQGLLTVSKFA
jgi:hypothetical protein